MTISVHYFLALLGVTATLAFIQISNSRPNPKLECGDEVETSQSYIKVLDCLRVEPGINTSMKCAAALQSQTKKPAPRFLQAWC